EQTRVELVLDVFPNTGLTDINEASNIRRVLTNEMLSDAEHVHREFQLPLTYLLEHSALSIAGDPNLWPHLQSSCPRTRGKLPLIHSSRIVSGDSRQHDVLRWLAEHDGLGSPRPAFKVLEPERLMPRRAGWLDNMDICCIHRISRTAQCAAP